MATLNIQIDQVRQQQLDRYCAMSGTDEKGVIAEMLNMWERLVYIPWIEFVEKEDKRRNLLGLMAQQREKIAKGEVNPLTMDEIDAEIAQARAERRSKNKEQ